MAEYIEYHLARYAQDIPDAGAAKKSETLLTNALGVLNEQGVYALFLYLRAENTAKTVAPKIGRGILTFLTDQKIHGDVEWSKSLRGKNFGDSKLFDALLPLCQSRDDLSYVHGLLEQLLTYARYHAKALPDKAERRQDAAPGQEETAPEPLREAAREVPLNQPASTSQKTTGEETARSPRVLGKIDLSKRE